MANVRIPTPLRKLTNDLEVVSAAGANVGEVLDNLDKAFPGLRERICDEFEVVGEFAEWGGDADGGHGNLRFRI